MPNSFVSLWQRLPVIIKAVLTGLFLSAAGTLPWAILVSANTKYWSDVPWAVPPTALYLWLYWRYVRGEWWPQSTSDSRRKNCRANRLPDQVWGAAIFAGVLGLIALVIFLSVFNRLVKLPAQQTGDVSHIPFLTLFCLLIMGSVVAGVVEETSFRGYMQGPIERRHGPVVAILITGMMFGFLHFNHPEVTMSLMPFYLFVAIIYGTLAYLTNSIWPSMLLHAGGNILSGLNLFTRGQSEWQASPGPVPLIWETGVDASFWISLVAFLAAGAATIWAYSALAVIARKSSESVPTEFK